MAQVLNLNNPRPKRYGDACLLLHPIWITIQGDGNCLFRCFSSILTGRQDQHADLRSAVVKHILQDDGNRYSNYTGMDAATYIKSKAMDEDAKYGTEVEILAFASLVGLDVYVYVFSQHNWLRYPVKALGSPPTAYGLYIKHSYEHYEVVVDIQK